MSHNRVPVYKDALGLLSLYHGNIHLAVRHHGVEKVNHYHQVLECYAGARWDVFTTREDIPVAKFTAMARILGCLDLGAMLASDLAYMAAGREEILKLGGYDTEDCRYLTYLTAECLSMRNDSDVGEIERLYRSAARAKPVSEFLELKRASMVEAQKAGRLNPIGEARLMAIQSALNPALAAVATSGTGTSGPDEGLVVQLATV